MKQYTCTICGYLYDEAAGVPNDGIAPGTLWGDVPEGWVCPLCKAAKQDFAEKRATPTAPQQKQPAQDDDGHHLRELTNAQLSAICSNLGKGCEKQYLEKEAALFFKLAEYFIGKSEAITVKSFEDLKSEMNLQLESGFPQASDIAAGRGDRGAMRTLVWNEKATRMLLSILRKYETEKNDMLANTKIYVCDICGFVFVGDDPPDICPICKVPKLKILPVQRR